MRETALCGTRVGLVIVGIIFAVGCLTVMSDVLLTRVVK